MKNTKDIDNKKRDKSKIYKKEVDMKILIQYNQ